MSALSDIAPRLARAHEAVRAQRMRGISRCWQGGWHFYAAGPCFDDPERAMRARDRYDIEQNRCLRGGTHVRRDHADVGECIKCGRWSVAPVETREGS